MILMKDYYFMSQPQWLDENSVEMKLLPGAPKEVIDSFNEFQRDYNKTKSEEMIVVEDDDEEMMNNMFNIKEDKKDGVHKQ